MSWKRINATAVMTLSESNVEFLRKIQMNHPIPEGATHIAFLEDGDACFLDELEVAIPLRIPKFVVLTYFTDIPIEFKD